MKHVMLGFISLLLCQGIFALADQNRDAANEVAQKGYRQFLEKCLTTAGRANYGISPTEKISDFSIGEAIEKMNLTPKAIVEYKQGQGVSKLLTPNNGYYFPVILNGEAKLMLSVHKWPGENHFEISSLGDGFLAEEYNKLKNQLFCSNGHKMIYADCYEANSCVISFPELDNQNLTFINIDPTRQSDYSALDSVDEVVKVMDGNIYLGTKMEIMKGEEK